MDQNTGAPEIKPEVNKEEERKSGILGSLFAKLGGAGAGGLLATKAGIIGLALIGSTVAGGLGVVGYKAFGPGSEQAGGYGYSSLFEARSPSAESSSSSDYSAPSDGSSKSLDFLVKANNSGSEEPQEASATAETDKPADAAANGAAGAASTEAPNAASGNNALGAAKFKIEKKLSDLSKAGATGGSGGTSASGGGTASVASAQSAGRSSASPRAAGGSNRGLGNMRKAGGGSALRQLGMVKADQKLAGTSAQAGKTYDGNSGSSGSGIAAENSINGGGAGVGGAGVGRGPSATPNSSANDRFPEPPATEDGANVTPWQAAIKTAILLVTAAAALLFIAGKLAKAGPQSMTIAQVLAGLAGLLGLAVIALGAMIGGGAYGQPLQGGLLAIAGGAITASAAVAIFGKSSGLRPGQSPGMMMTVLGGAGLAAAAAAFMMHPKSFPAATFKDGRPPDWDNKFEKNQGACIPSEKALREYLA